MANIQENVFHRFFFLQMLCGFFNLLNKLQCIIVDNASANAKFLPQLAKILPDLEPQNQRFCCMVYILNLGMEDLMTNLTLENNYEIDGDITIAADESEEDHDQEHTPQLDDIRYSSTANTKIRSIFTE